MDVNQVKALLVELVSGGMCFFIFRKLSFHTHSVITLSEKRKFFLPQVFPKHRQKQSKEKTLTITIVVFIIPIFSYWSV